MSEETWFPAHHVDFCDEGLVFTMESELKAQQAHLEGLRVGSFPTQVRGNQLIMFIGKKDQSEEQAHSGLEAD
jgi:hypothetical protein